VLGLDLRKHLRIAYCAVLVTSLFMRCAMVRHDSPFSSDSLPDKQFYKGLCQEKCTVLLKSKTQAKHSSQTQDTSRVSNREDILIRYVTWKTLLYLQY